MSSLWNKAIKQRLKYSESIFLSDIHIPCQDPAALGVALGYVFERQPKYLYIVGDLVEFDHQSMKHPVKPERILEIQSDLKKVTGLLTYIRQRLPRTKIVFREGNHDYRLQKFLWKHPQIASLEALKLENLFELKKLKIDFVGFYEALDHFGFAVEHGDKSRSHSGYTAKAYIDRYQVSGLNAHTHRLGMVFQTDRTGTKVWAENGCLRTLDVEWQSGPTNWQSGFTQGFWYGDGSRFSLRQHHIVDGKLLADNEIWSS